jgi:transposase-like protein
LRLRSGVGVLISALELGAGGPAENKGVAESYAPGAVVSEVARRHEITPQHLFAWREAARAGRLIVPAEEAPVFVPVVTASRELEAASAPANEPASIVIESRVITRACHPSRRRGLVSRAWGLPHTHRGERKSHQRAAPTCGGAFGVRGK